MGVARTLLVWLLAIWAVEIVAALVVTGVMMAKARFRRRLADSGSAD